MKTNLQKLLLVALVTFSGCYIDDSNPGPIPDNGDASITGQVVHHNDPIAKAKVYLKRNSPNFPGPDTRMYDDSTTANEIGFYEFNNLLQGSYYLYSVGYDSAFSEVVKGGIPILIDAPGKPVNTNIPIAE